MRGLIHKKSVNFDSHNNTRKTTNNQSFSKDLGNSRASQRQSSLNRLSKNQKTLIPTSISTQKLSGMDKANLNQKIKVIVRDKGFLLQKKYIGLELQASINIQTQGLLPFTYQPKFIPNQETSEKDILLVTLTTDKTNVYLWINGIRHGYKVVKDNKQFLQIQLPEYCELSSISISNRRLQLIDLASQLQIATQSINDQMKITDIQLDKAQYSTIKPFELYEEAFYDRNHRIKSFEILKAQDKSRMVNICWNSVKSDQNEHDENVENNKATGEMGKRSRRISSITKRNREQNSVERNKRSSQQIKVSYQKDENQPKIQLSRLFVEKKERKKSLAKEVEKYKKISNLFTDKLNHRNNATFEKQNLISDYYAGETKPSKNHCDHQQIIANKQDFQNYGLSDGY